MNFTEYYQLSEDAKLFDECLSIDENFLTTPAKFLGGAATNLASQILRGAGNITGGLARTAYGGAQAGTGALQAAAGGFEPGWENIKKGASTAASGLGQSLKGAAQAAASPISAAFRGAQATTEPMFPTTGFSKDRSWAQKTFGLNKWNQDEPTKTPEVSEWRKLVRAYKATKDESERIKILQQLRELDPERYAQAKKMGQQMKTKRFLASLEKSHAPAIA